MWNNSARLVVWALDPLLDLENLRELLQRNYNHPIDFLAGNENLPTFEKVLQNKWISPESDKAIKISEMDILEENFKFISAIGTYETNLGEDRSIINGTVLPRQVRVFNHAVKVLFFEFFGRVYCILEVTKSHESKIRSALFGQRRKARMEEWGKIEYKEPLPFMFSSKFYYWLFGKKGESLKLEEDDTNKEINLIDVSAVSHLADKDAYDSSSTGADILGGSVSALSGLGSNEEVYQAGFKLTIESTNLMISFGLNGICIVDLDTCYYNKESEEIRRFFQTDFEYFILIIYGVTLPKLLEMFNTEVDNKVWNDQLENGLRKQWALKVIKNLSVHNNIFLSDLETIIKS